MTTVRHVLLKREWRPLSGDKNLELLSLLNEWRGTKYMPGCQGKQMGVDCVRFVCAILDSLLGLSTPIQALPQDAAFHQPDRGHGAVRQLLRLYEPTEAVARNSFLMPADVLVVGGPKGGPGHAILVGPEPNTLWQSDGGTGVCRGGFSLAQTYQTLHRVYRISNLEERWSLSCPSS